MATGFIDKFSGIAAEYARYRPVYPQAIWSLIASHVKSGHNVALDVGCGNGQATLGLAQVYNKVIGRDPSAKQIEFAASAPNITYEVGPAEVLSSEDNSVDLINVAQAAHWFDLDKFFVECKRVLRKGGAVSIVGYGTVIFDDNEAANDALQHVYSGILGKHWDDRRVMIDNSYSDIHPPFKTVVRYTNPPCLDTPRMEKKFTIADLILYVNTWSAFNTLREDGQADKILADLEQNIMKAYNAPDNSYVVSVHFPLFTIIASDA